MHQRQSIPVWLYGDERFPDPNRAPRDGFLAIGGGLSVPRLLEAYRHGIFPWYSEGYPVLWWSPDPRLLIFPGELHVPARLERVIAKHSFDISIDRAFPEVIRACASSPRKNQPGTWITSEMIDAYIDLHEAGHAHSLEIWQSGQLVGGIYGVAMGRCFFGESMFSVVSNASKVALVTLARRMEAFKYAFLDCQLPNPHLDQFNPRRVPRREFLKLVAKEAHEPEPPDMWTTA